MVYIRFNMFETSEILLPTVVVILMGIVAGFIYLWKKEHAPVQKNPAEKKSQTADIITVQAYEKVIIFVDRCGFGSLLERLPAGSLTAQQLALVYKETMRSEFEYILSQQIYVSAGIWQAVCDLRDQQLFIINQLLGALPDDATGHLLEMAIQTLLKADQHASMQPQVLDAVKNEARQHLLHI